MVLSQTDVEGLIRTAEPANDSYPATDNTDEWYYLGTNESVDTYEVNNNVTRVGQLGGRQSIELLEANFEGSFSVTFDLAYDASSVEDDTPHGFEWLDGITTASAGTDLDGAEASADSDDVYDFDDVSWFDLAIDRPSATTIAYAKGCVATSFSIEANVDETVTVSMDGFYADVATTDITDANIQSRPDAFETVMFDEVEVAYGGSTLNCPQGVTVDAENNVTPFRCLSGASEDRTIQAIATGNFNPSVTIEDLIDFSNNGVSALDRALGGSAVSSVDDNDPTEDTVNFNLYRGGSQEVAIELGGSLIDTYSMSGITADADAVTQEINETARTMAVDINTS